MKDLLTRALDAHGGLSRWREIEAFQLKVSIGGGLWRLKGLPDGLRDVTLRIQAHRPIVTITPFGGEARTGHFTPDRVWVEDANGSVVEERATPRASFAGHVLTTPWDTLQELSFVSYALWNYLATPFVCTEPGFETRESGPQEKNNDRERTTVRCEEVLGNQGPEHGLYRRGRRRSHRFRAWKPDLILSVAQRHAGLSWPGPADCLRHDRNGRFRETSRLWPRPLHLRGAAQFSVRALEKAEGR